VEWLKQGWQIFVANPGVWIAIAVILFVIFFILSLIPMIGQLALNFLMPIFSAGLLLGCRAMAKGEELRIDHLFAGFQNNVGNLIMVGVFYLVGSALIMLIVFMVGGGAAFSGAMMGGMDGVGMIGAGFMLAMLLMLLLSIPLMMAIYFAPALVVFRNAAPLDAMKISFGACLKNMVPFLVYGVVVLVLVFIAVLPFGLGLLVLMPVLAGALYHSYTDIFE